MQKQYKWQIRIKLIRIEFASMRQASAHFVASVRDDPSLLKDQLRPRDLQTAADKLEDTYIIRLFAEFETGLKSYWKTVKKTNPKMEYLLNSIASRLGIDHRELANAHLVREYRNALVHERDDRPDPVPLIDAEKHLCRFFSYLPDEW